MKTQREVLNGLEVYLKALEAMEPLEPSGKDLSPEEEAAWKDQHERIQRLVRDAEYEAECLLPAEVRLILAKVRLSARGLYSVQEWLLG